MNARQRRTLVRKLARIGATAERSAAGWLPIFDGKQAGHMFGSTQASAARYAARLVGRFCWHCPGDGVHKMSCAANKGGYVDICEPCRTFNLRALRPDESRARITTDEVKP